VLKTSLFLKQHISCYCTTPVFRSMLSVWKWELLAFSVFPFRRSRSKEVETAKSNHKLKTSWSFFASLRCISAMLKQAAQYVSVKNYRLQYKYQPPFWVFLAFSLVGYSAPDLDGREPGVQAWWEAPYADRIRIFREVMADEITSISTDHYYLWRNLVTSHLLTQA